MGRIGDSTKGWFDEVSDIGGVWGSVYGYEYYTYGEFGLVVGYER